MKNKDKRPVPGQLPVLKDLPRVTIQLPIFNEMYVADRLIDAIEVLLIKNRLTLEVSIDPADGAGLSWLYRHSEVLSREMNVEGRFALSVRADRKNAALVKHKYPVTTEVKPPG